MKQALTEGRLSLSQRQVTQVLNPQQALLSSECKQAPHPTPVPPPRKGCNSLWAGVPGGGKQEEPYHLSNPGPLPTLSPLFLYPESLGSQGRHDDFSLYPAL